LGAELFQTIIEINPNYPLEQTDIYGNTVFLLAFINGNEDLCRLALKYNVCLGTANHQGDTIFRINTPTKQLLFGLLSNLDREPKWADGDFCSECESKFTLTMRKHHCRHCGRVICSKCTSAEIPILKYNLQKPVRVCATCYDILTIGAKEIA
jgi:ankyrin repeat protein